MRAAGAADIVTERTAGGGFTVRAALPDLLPSKTEVAVIVAVPTATPVTTPA
jgi:hypothetical protein